jgi:molybdenum cofactor biosynthesis protein B
MAMKSRERHPAKLPLFRNTALALFIRSRLFQTVSIETRSQPDMSKTAIDASFIPLRVAVITISDSRTAENDRSGDFLVDGLESEGHLLALRKIVRDDHYVLRAEVSALIADPEVNVILTTGSTGLTGRDVAPEALEPLFDKAIDGFGELFRAASVADIGAATIQSRAFAGLANGTIIFCMPGSPGACRTAWEEVIRPQLDSRTRPCNLANLMPRFLEK